MNEVGIFSALFGGLLTFLAPCTFPLIPAYVGFLAGAGEGTAKDGSTALKRKILTNGVLFVLGFTSVFMFFGLISGAVGVFFALHRMFFTQIGGVVIILFGLFMLKIIRLPSLFRRSGIPKVLAPGRPSSSFLLGFFFGFGWSPCLGPILGTILLLAGTTGSVGYGAFLLFCYSLGLAVPFLLIAYFYGTSFSYIVKLQSFLPMVEKVAGVLLIIIGTMLLIGEFGMFNVWIGESWRGSWYEQLMDYM